MVAQELSVGEVARRSGVAVSALHFYERKGLIHSLRTAGNQRRYARDPVADAKAQGATVLAVLSASPFVAGKDARHVALLGERAREAGTSAYVLKSEPIAALVFFSAIAAPAIYLLAVWYVSALVTLGLHWPGRRFFFAVARHLEAWNLMPVFAVACVVSVVKLRTLGEVTWEPGAIWIAALSLFTLLAIQFFDRRFVAVELEENP